MSNVQYLTSKHKNMKNSIILALLLLAVAAKAQLIEAPLDYNKSLFGANVALAQRPANTDTLNLPFLDEFSYSGVYPSAALWQNSNSVWVNTGMAQNPPTIGVATFDGLNKTGRPYSWISNSGACDTLTSLPINLLNRAAGVNYTTADSIYLSFFYQLGGNGDMPEVSDKFLIEFKKNDGTWVLMKQINGQTGNPPAFKQVAILLTNNYLYKGFQFRFRNVGSQRGARDHWHIDYVKMATNRRYAEPSYNDVAFYDVPSSPFINYTAMPYSHFKASQPSNIMTTDAVLKVRNSFSDPKSPILHIAVSEAYSGAVILTDRSPGIPANPVIVGGGTANITLNIGTPFYDFSGLPQNTDTALLTVRYSFANITGQDTLQEVRNNDAVTRHIALRNYFAYDDGGAESSIITQNVGTQAAVKFHTVIADTLQGIQLHIPAFDNDVSNQLFNFKVYVGSLTGGTAVFSQDLMRPSYGDSLQYWATYPFRNGTSLPPFIPANTDFYVVWQQASTAYPIPIGLDKNSTAGTQFIYQNTGSGWQAISATVSGAMMLRPFVGNTRLVGTSDKMGTRLTANVYPNPVQDLLNVNMNDENIETYNYTLTNALGQTIQQGQLSPTIPTAALAEGIYYLKIQHKVTLASLTLKIVK
jgi:hypothetical protein